MHIERRGNGRYIAIYIGLLEIFIWRDGGLHISMPSMEFPGFYWRLIT